MRPVAAAATDNTENRQIREGAFAPRRVHAQQESAIRASALQRCAASYYEAICGFKDDIAERGGGARVCRSAGSARCGER